MRLYKDGAFVDDPWHTLGDDEALGEGPAILSLQAWLALGEARRGINTPVGVRLDGGEMVDAILPDLDRLSLVALSFPKFGDGRSFSKASILRGQYGFKGEIRAVGDVLWDQLQLMRRCGFDAFLIEDAPTLRALESGRTPWMTEFYQPGRGGETPADPRRPWTRRSAAGA
jgi:phosphoadenosine phosphosulfate reductase